MSEGFEEADIRAGLREGGSILSAFIISRPAAVQNDAEYVVYLRTSWRRGYHILQTRRKRSERIYMATGLGRLVWMLRHELGFWAPLTLYEAGDDALQRFVGLRSIDHGRPQDAGPPRAAPPKPPWEWPIIYPQDDADHKPAPPDHTEPENPEEE